MSILKPRAVPVPSFRTPYVSTHESAHTNAPISVQQNPLPPLPKPNVVKPKPESGPAESEVQTSEPSKPKRTRNTRHPTVKPLDKPRSPVPERRRGGQRRHVAHTVRDVKIIVSLSREEASIWHDCATREGRSMAEWVRRTMFDVAKIAPRPHPERDVAMGTIDPTTRPRNR